MQLFLFWLGLKLIAAAISLFVAEGAGLIAVFWIKRDEVHRRMHSPYVPMHIDLWRRLIAARDTEMAFAALPRWKQILYSINAAVFGVIIAVLAVYAIPVMVVVGIDLVVASTAARFVTPWIVWPVFSGIATVILAVFVGPESNVVAVALIVGAIASRSITPWLVWSIVVMVSGPVLWALIER